MSRAVFLLICLSFAVACVAVLPSPFTLAEQLTSKLMNDVRVSVNAHANKFHLMSGGAGTFNLSACMDAVKMPTMPSKNAASAACRAATIPNQDALQEALELTLTTHPEGTCDAAAQDQASKRKQAVTCTTTYSYDATALNTYKNGVSSAGRMIAIDTSMQLANSLYLAAGKTVMVDMFMDVTTNQNGMISAIPNVCTEADVRQVLNQVQVVVQSLNTAIGQARQCVATAANEYGFTASWNIRFGLGMSIYTGFDANNKPVQSSKLTVQAATSAAPALATPAHVGLLTAAAVVMALLAFVR